MTPGRGRRFGVLLAAIVCALSGLGAWIALPLPDGLLGAPDTGSLRIEDRHGLLLRATRADDGTRAAWIPLAEMDPDLPRAFVAVEDRRFFRHHGVDPRAVARALRDDLTQRRIVSGASTITMQLARLLRPIGRGPIDKLLQVAWAFRLEAHLSKQEILEQYLNRVPLGQGTAGVAAAMRLYFGASATEASLGQAALLAALARTPSSQNPLVASGAARRRRTLGLTTLGKQGYASREELTRAGQEPLLGLAGNPPFLAPHFTSRLLQWEEGEGRPLRGAWRTSLDLPLQEALEGEVRHTVEQLADRGARHAALVVLDNPTGEILAWVGSPDFWSDTAGQVDMVVSPRQPGSALKPFLYALAFDRGVTPGTILADVDRTYETASGPYHPRNYDRRYHGPVRAREALASSFNVPAVELADRLGYATLWRGLLDAGFRSLDRGPEFYGLGLALGNGDVSLLELANGYRTLANGGIWTPYRTWTGPREPSGAGRRVVSAGAAAQVLDILADADARVPGFGVQTPFDWPFRAAAKTGTSRHFTDNWAVAVTAGFTVAVWVGNFNGRPMDGVSGVSGAGPLLHRATLVTATFHPPGELVRPEESGLEPHVLCRLSGMAAGAHCPRITEYFKPGTAPAVPCDWHRDDGYRLPAQFAEWAATTDATPANSPIPERDRLVAGAATLEHRSGELVITSPQDGDRYAIPPGVDRRYASVALRATGDRTGDPIRWFIDGRRYGSSRWVLERGRHEVRAEIRGARATAVIMVE